MGHSTYSAAAKRTAVRRYKAGETTAAIAKSLGMSQATVTRAVKAAGVRLRDARLTGDEQERIANRYADGESAADLAHEFHCTEATVYRALRAKGVDTHVQMRPLSGVEKADAERRYRAGEHTTTIAETYGVLPQSIGYMLRSRGVPMRNKREAARTCELDETAFDRLTPDALYWCGFLVADGHLAAPRPGVSAKIQLTLKADDIAHVQRLRTFLGSTHTIGVWDQQPSAFGSGRAAGLSVNSPRLAARLCALGLAHYKPDHEPVLALTESHHFWRGVIDGDGTVGDYAAGPAIVLYGHEPVVSMFRAWFAARGLSRANVYPVKGKTIYRVGTGGGAAARIVHALYADAPTALDRKMAAARSIMRKAAIAAQA